MSDSFKTVYEGGMGEIEEKKSRFIAHIQPVHSEEEAQAFIASIKKKYWDARHNCSAFVIGKSREITRSSDDGEPSGTAGKPILEVLLGEDLTDTACVVTRYFGGTLLGTGGLIRAYTQAVKAGLSESVVIEKLVGVRVSIKTDYSNEGKVRRYLSDNEFPIEEPVYSDKVMLSTVVKASDADTVMEELLQLLNGSAIIEKLDEVVFANVKGSVMYF